MNEVIGAMGNGGAVRGGRVIIFFALLPTPVPYILYSTPIYVLLVGEVEDGVIGRAIGAITHTPLLASTPLFAAAVLSFKEEHIYFLHIICIWLRSHKFRWCWNTTRQG